MMRCVWYGDVDEVGWSTSGSISIRCFGRGPAEQTYAATWPGVSSTTLSECSACGSICCFVDKSLLYSLSICNFINCCNLMGGWCGAMCFVAQMV
jgi:hypothetical protein